MSLDEKLDQLAERDDGEITIAPEQAQDAESFQATVDRVREYEQQDFVVIVHESVNHTPVYDKLLGWGYA